MTVDDVISYLQNGKYEQAIKKVDDLLLAGGETRELLPLKVSALIELGQTAAAESNATELLALLPRDAYAQFLNLRIRFLRGERNLQTELQDILRHADNLTEAVKEKVYNLLGQCCRFFGDAAGAVAAYQKAAELADTQELKAVEYSNALFNLHYCENNEQKTKQLTARYNEIFAKIPQFFHGPREKREKLRIGYISADIREHVVLKFCYALFRSYNREKYEVYCYSRSYEDGYSRKVMGMIDVWRNVTGQTAADIAYIIYNDNLDILVDLGGHTQGNSLPVLAYKPAPVQISGIGYFATTGLKSVDYFLSDGWLCGLGEQAEATIIPVRDFTEKLLVMPKTHFCYLPFGGLPEAGPAPCLKNGYVTFGSFNNFTKLTKRVLEIWREILARVSNSRLLIKCEVFNQEDNMQVAQEKLAAAGIELAQVECRGTTRDYMAEYADVDIALDTFPYPGGGTTFDALYMGVPVITLSGKGHGERFGNSILNNLGLSEFVAETVEQYIERAVGLAGDFELLTVLHQNLRTILKNSPLMAESEYVRNMEAGYELVWQKYQGDYQPLSVREAAQKISQLRQLLVAKDYQQARQLAKAIEAAGHLDIHALEELAAVYIDTGDAVGAERITNALLIKKTRDGYALFLRSRALFLAKDYEKSIELAKQALTLKNLSADIRIMVLDILGKASKESGQTEPALAAYWQTVELEQDIVQKRRHYDNYLFMLHYVESEGQFLKEKAIG